jgi:hypothetical protein
MNGIAKTLKGYIWWTYPRGCFHYDVMVTVILLFIFVAPLFIGFNDKPVERTAHLTGVIVTPEGKNGFVCRIEASAIQGETEADIRDGLMRVIEPIAGEVKFIRYEAVRDNKGKIIAYNVWVQRGLGG